MNSERTISNNNLLLYISSINFLRSLFLLVIFPLTFYLHSIFPFYLLDPSMLLINLHFIFSYLATITVSLRPATGVPGYFPYILSKAILYSNKIWNIIWNVRRNIRYYTLILKWYMLSLCLLLYVVVYHIVIYYIRTTGSIHNRLDDVYIL